MDEVWEPLRVWRSTCLIGDVLAEWGRRRSGSPEAMSPEITGVAAPVPHNVPPGSPALVHS